MTIPHATTPNSSLLFISSHTIPHPHSKSRKTMFDPPRNQSSNTHDHNNWNFVSKDRILAQNHEVSIGNWYSDQGHVVQLRPNNQNQESIDDDSGVCSPPLWKNSPSPPRSPSQPLLSHYHHNNHRSLSPNSRHQAIIRGQMELMEMVKNMPESSYELSLKDLVEHRPEIESQAPKEERSKNNDQRLRQRGGMEVKREQSKRYDKNMMRSGSLENKGLFLNMVFPISFNSKKKKSSFASNISVKASPKPDVVKSGGERDWWKKKFTGSSDSDSSRTSNNSGSSGSTASSGGGSSDTSYTAGRTKNGLLNGCWPFLQSRKYKTED